MAVRQPLSQRGGGILLHSYQHPDLWPSELGDSGGWQGPAGMSYGLIEANRLEFGGLGAVRVAGPVCWHLSNQRKHVL